MTTLTPEKARTELLPCPFPHAHEEYEATFSYSENSEGHKHHFVECSTCGCMGPIADTSLKAGKLWNERPATPAPAGWVMEEPTKEMLDAGYKAFGECLYEIFSKGGWAEKAAYIYKRMRAAAPAVSNPDGWKDRIQWNGGNYKHLNIFCGNNWTRADAVNLPGPNDKENVVVWNSVLEQYLNVPIGAWIVRGKHGEFNVEVNA